MKLIICGVKCLGREHMQRVIDAVIEADRYTKMVVGFDMVNEEDYHPGIENYVD